MSRQDDYRLMHGEVFTLLGAQRHWQWNKRRYRLNSAGREKRALKSMEGTLNKDMGMQTGWQG